MKPRDKLTNRLLLDKNANVKTVACTYGFHETDPHSWQADYIINEPIELKNVI